MKLIAYESEGTPRVGVESESGVFDTGYRDMIELIEDGERGLDAARAAIDASAPVAPEKILAPLTPGKIYGTGINYARHVEENPAFVAPDEPIVNFIKPSSAIIGPGEAIRLPDPNGYISRPDGFKVSYEVELGIVIGRGARHSPRADAHKHIFGFTIMNDVTSGAMIDKNYQLTLAKSFDTFAPLGPCVVTADEIEDWNGLRLTCSVNGRVYQDDTVAGQIYPPDHLIAWLSAVSTLNPGDLISTGTPPGIPFFADEPRYLQTGDVVVCAIDGIGRLENPVV